MRDTLLKARAEIECGMEHHICIALFKIGGRESIKLESWIQRLLGGPFTLTEWQDKVGLGRRSNEQQRLDRLAWIDWMLDWHGSDETPPCVGVYRTKYDQESWIFEYDAYWDGKMWRRVGDGKIFDYQTRKWRLV